MNGLLLAAFAQIVVISPKDLADIWRDVYARRAPAATGGSYEVVSTDAIYAAYPYAASNTDGRPRNPAESIHAYIAAHAEEAEAFVLGGPWVDVADLATNRVMKLATGETLTLDNTVPGVKVRPDDRYCSPSDMYYACLDAGNAYAWDANGDGVYLDSASFADSSVRADVVVTRIPLVTWAGWEHADGTLFTQRELLSAYVDKLSRGLAADFEGNSRYGVYGYLINESTVPRLGGPDEAWVERQETSFYDGGYNMFDPARGTDEFWLVEGVSRRHVRDQIARARPVGEVNGFLEATFSRRHADREAARAEWTGGNYAMRYYYAHGTRGGGHGFGMDDYAREGCGLTLFDDCAGPCSTGRIEFDANGVYQMNYAIACVMSPFGGSLATVNNTDFGIADLRNYWKTFAPNDSWRYANNYLVGFVMSNMTVGAAWRYNVEDFVSNYRYNKSGIDTWMLAEEMLLGDPLVKLPPVENDLDFGLADVTYRGLRGQTDAVVSASVGNGTAIVAPERPFRVLDGLSVEGAALTLCTGEGGVGGRGIVFTGAKGALTLAGDAPFFVAGVTNVSKVTIQGSHMTVDFDRVYLDGSELGQLTISSAQDVTIRSSNEGSFAKIRNTLSVPRGGSVRLATWNAFGNAGSGEIFLAKDSELVIGANPWYHDGRDRGESLNATITVLGSTYRPKVRVEKGGYFTPVSPLSSAGGLAYEVDGRDGIGGEVTVPSKARLTLKELPLSKIERLTVERGGTLELPEEKTLEDLVASGVAVIKAGATVVCGGVAAVVEADREIVGDDYVTKYYYTSGNVNWTASVKTSLDKGGTADTLPTAKGEVVFAMGGTFPAAAGDCLYISSDVVCKHVRVCDGTTLKLGAESSQKWNLREGFRVDVEAGSTLLLRGWGNGGQAQTNPAKIADGVVLDGEGVVTIDVADAPVCTWGSLSGTATILIPEGVTVTCTGTIANPLAVPEGCELLQTASGTATLYRAVRRRTIYWDSTANKEWSSKAGGDPSFTDADGVAVTYRLGDTVVVRRTQDNELWLGSVASGVPFVIDGCAEQIENESKGGSIFTGSEVEVVNGGSLAYRSRWNGVKLKDATIRLAAGTSFGPYAQWSEVAVDIEGKVTFSGEGAVSFGARGARLATAESSLVVPLRAPAMTVTCAVDGYRVVCDYADDSATYRAVPEEPEVPEADRALADWAEDHGLTYAEARESARFDAEGRPLTRTAEAFLLGCADDSAAIADAKAEFRFRAIEPGRVPTIDGARYNGTVTIWGATTLESGGDWMREDGAATGTTRHFFKATLTR